MSVSKITTYWHFVHVLECRACVTFILWLSQLRVRGTLGVGLTVLSAWEWLQTRQLKQLPGVSNIPVMMWSINNCATRCHDTNQVRDSYSASRIRGWYFYIPSKSRGRVKVECLYVTWRCCNYLGVMVWGHTIFLWLLLGNIFIVEVNKCLPTYIIPYMKVVQVLHPHLPMIQTKVHPINLVVGSQSQCWIKML